MIEFTVTMPDFGEISERGVTRAHKAGGTAAAEWFKEERLPLRFTDRSLQTELGYAQRSEEYQSRKMRIKKRAGFHNYTGKTQGIARRNAKPRVTKKFIGVKIDGLGVQYGRRKKGSSRIDLRSELLRLSRSEQKTFAEIYEKAFVAKLQEEIDRASRRRRR